MEKLSFKSADGKIISYYEFKPKSIIKGSLVLVYEIFGFTSHIKALAEDFADQGYIVLVPDLFERKEKNLVLEYNNSGIEKGRMIKNELGFEYPVMDIQFCGSILKQDYNVGLVGYCYGGSLAWRTIQKSYLFDCAISYYGGDIHSLLDISPNCPALLHFGMLDKSIPKEKLEDITKFTESSSKEIELYKYENADHGFNCSDRPSYCEKSAGLAKNRSLAFLNKHLNIKE